MKAIIQARNSGERFLADYGPHGLHLSGPLPVTDATDPETGKIDWSQFEDADTEQVHRGDATNWHDDRFAVIHRFD